MAEEQENHKYDDKLSVGNYAAKQIYQLVVGIGAPFAGAWAGLVAAKNIIKDVGAKPDALSDMLKKLPGLKSGFTTKQLMWGGFGGLLAGSIIAELALGFGHWKKEKQAQLQVDEITKDISDIEVFKKTDPELKAENQRLWSELKKREGGSFSEKLRNEEKPKAEKHAKKKEHWKDAVETSSAESQEAAR